MVQIPPLNAIAESWNGSNWTEVAVLATARGYAAAGWNKYSFNSFAGGKHLQKQQPQKNGLSQVYHQQHQQLDYADAITGDFYYNSTTGQFKTVNTGGAPIGSWGSGGNLNTRPDTG